MNDKTDKQKNETAGNKYDRAVAQARAKEAGTELATQGAAGELDTATLPAGMLVSSRDAMQMLSEKVKSGEWEQAPQLLTLKKGQTLIAHLEGNGAPAEFVDEDTGEVTTEKTWVLSKDGVRVSILGSAQLNKKLPPFEGGLVSITRGDDVRNGTRIYTEYLVIGPKRADGSPRDWANKALPAASSTPDLTAPNKAVS